MLDQGKDHLWIVSGDVGKGDSRMGNGKPRIVLLGKQFQQTVGEMPFGVSVNLRCGAIGGKIQVVGIDFGIIVSDASHRHRATVPRLQIWKQLPNDVIGGDEIDLKHVVKACVAGFSWDTVRPGVVDKTVYGDVLEGFCNCFHRCKILQIHC